MGAGADSGAGVDSAGAGEDSNGEFLGCFGRQMKRLREAAGLTQAQSGERVGYGEALIAAVEQGRRIPRPERVDAVDQQVGARGVLVAMKGEVAKARYPGFFRAFAALEAHVAELHAYDARLVNGPLQCEEYARAVFGMRRPLLDAETVEQRMSARLDRQKLMARRPRPLLSFVIEESVLRRPLGGAEVLHQHPACGAGEGPGVRVHVRSPASTSDAPQGIAGPDREALGRGVKANDDQAAELTWVKSSYSAGDGGQCVEAAAAGSAVLVRDSKQPDAAVLSVSTARWTAFVRMTAGV